jgi:hypothetical protein
MRDKSLPQIAAIQWESANRIALDDLAKIDRSRWTTVTYEDLVADPHAVIERLTKFLGLGLDAGLAQRLGAPLPPSRQTNTPAAPDKWRKYQDEIEALLPALQRTIDRLLRN